MVWVILPIKDFVQAKTRLSGVLAPHERRSLMQAMVEDVLSVLCSHSEIERVVLVSDDPAAELLAGKYQIESLDERSLGSQGLNSAVTAASDVLIGQGATKLLVMHGDIPLLAATDISALVDSFHAGDVDVVIAPDEAGTGTNALLFSANNPPLFEFGENSCQKHMESIVGSAGKVRRIDRLGLALDIDEPADLHRLVIAMESGEGGEHCRELMLESGVHQRLKAMAEDGFDLVVVRSATVSEG